MWETRSVLARSPVCDSIQIDECHLNLPKLTQIFTLLRMLREHSMLSNFIVLDERHSVISRRCGCEYYESIVRFSFSWQTRDYLRNRKTSSWLYMARLAAAKEFAFMKVKIEIWSENSIEFMQFYPGTSRARISCSSTDWFQSTCCCDGACEWISIVWRLTMIFPNLFIRLQVSSSRCEESRQGWFMLYRATSLVIAILTVISSVNDSNSQSCQPRAHSRRLQRIQPPCQ